MKVLIAPDKFKDAVDAPSAARAMAAGVRDARPDAEIVELPLADGGEGTGEILSGVLGGEARSLSVRGPLGEPRSATWWWVERKRLAIVELAEAVGIQLIAPARRKATQTSTFGLGQLLRGVTDWPVAQILLCVGGSATVDGGAGCLQALGWVARDAGGATVDEPLTGGTLLQVASLDPPAERPLANVSSLTILADVENPLLGRDGAARAFGPQKGATPVEVELLDAGLRHWASLLASQTGRVVHAMKHGGAAGGVPAALAAALGARCESGFDVVAQSVDLAGRLATCDVCLTGEGKLDATSAAGKVVSGVADFGRRADRPVVALVGQARGPGGEGPESIARRLGLTAVRVISDESRPLEERLASTRDDLRRAAREHFTVVRES